jgi:hypothetical protein
MDWLTEAACKDSRNYAGYEARSSAARGVGGWALVTRGC